MATLDRITLSGAPGSPKSDYLYFKNSTIG